MKLDVIPPKPGGRKPWYADGLDFTCTQCGNCCGGAPGYVWVSRDDIVRIAGYLKITPEEMVEQYCRKVSGQFSLNEGKGPGSDYDCVFLREEKVSRPAQLGDAQLGDVGSGGARSGGAGSGEADSSCAGSSGAGSGNVASVETVTLARRYCSVYPVRPLQCRTWPFWGENLTSRKAWDHSARRCHGMNFGDRRFTREQIEAVRDAEKWPENPPTSAPSPTSAPENVASAPPTMASSHAPPR